MSNNYMIAAAVLLLASTSACMTEEQTSRSSGNTNAIVAADNSTQDGDMVRSGSTETMTSIPTYVPIRDSMGNMISASARLEGLFIKEGNCMMVVVDDRKLVTVFPEGMATSSATGVTYKEKLLKFGSKVDLAGGFMSRDEVVKVKNLPADCPTSSFWKVG